MDWIKVKVTHAEFDFDGAPDNAFRAWIRLMTLVAFIERRPTSAQIIARLGNDNYNALQTQLQSHNVTIDNIIDKVLEDVEDIKYRRIKGKERKDRFDNAHHNALRTPLRTEAEEEDKKNKKKKIIDGSYDPTVCKMIKETIGKMK